MARKYAALRKRVMTVSSAMLAAVLAVTLGTPTASAQQIVPWPSNPSWAKNAEFNEGLRAFYENAGKDLSRWCDTDYSTDEKCHLQPPKDLGTIRLGETYSGYYKPNGYLGGEDYRVEKNPNYGLTIQTYQARLEPGHYGYLTVSNDGESGYDAPLIQTEFSEADDHSDSFYLTWIGYLGLEAIYNSQTSTSSLKNWLLTENRRTWDGEVYLNGDETFLKHVRFGSAMGGAVLGSRESDQDCTYLWVNAEDSPSTVWYSIASAELSAPRDRYHVTFVNSPTKLPEDVRSFTPHVTDIAWLKDQGITQGFPDGTYRGMSSVVRQDMAAFLRRLAVKNNIGDAESWKPAASDWNTFKDVNRNTPHAEDILWLAHAGISEGWVERDGSRTFRGMSSVVRQDMAAFLKRLAAKAGKDGGVTPKSFKDVNKNTPHAAEIGWLAGAGISTGYEDGTFRGMTPVYRQDMAAFLHRLDTHIAK